MKVLVEKNQTHHTKENVMGFLEEIYSFVSKISDKITDIVDHLTDWLESPAGQQVTDITVEIVAIIVKILDMINPEPLTGTQKRELAREITRFVVSAQPEALDRLAFLKREGELSSMTYSQLDALVGNVIAAHVADQTKTLKKKGGKAK